MAQKKNISDAVIRRLPRYLRYLSEMHEHGVPRISSRELGERMGLTPSQIRQDFSHFGEFGQQGYGYRVGDLLDAIRHILALDREYHLAIVGAGNIGQAVAKYHNFREHGFCVDVLFDTDRRAGGAKRSKGSRSSIGTKAGDLFAEPPGGYRRDLRAPGCGTGGSGAADPGRRARYMEFRAPGTSVCPRGYWWRMST